LTRECNERLFRLVEESSLAFEQGHRTPLDANSVHRYCEQSLARLVSMRNHFVADNIYLLMDTVSPDCAHGPVMAPQIH
jgi:hypothetical protein